MRLVGRILGLVLGVVIVTASGLAIAFYSGTSFPVRQDTVQLSLRNWNKTGEFPAELTYAAGLGRKADRVLADIDLQVPNASQHLQSFLDGGRQRIVQCGPQDLYLYRMADAQLAIEDNNIAISGRAKMELAGLVKAHDDLPLDASVAFGHTETDLWLELTRLNISSLPDPMSDVLVRDISRVTMTREQVLDLAAKRLPAKFRPVLKKHRDALDLRFERIEPRLEGDRLHLATQVSVREGVVPEIISDLLKRASAGPVQVFAEVFSPAPAHADFFKELKKIGKQLEGAGRQLEEDLREGKDPLKAITSAINKSGVCKTDF